QVLAQATDGHEPDNPTWSPRQAEIAFTDLEPARPTPQDPTRSGMDSIFVIRPDGGGRHRIVRDIDGGFTPVWSPNGRMLAFTRSYGDVANLVVRPWVARADGREAHPVGPLLDSFDMSEPAWSLDGRFLAVEGRPVKKGGHPISQNAHVTRLDPNLLPPKPPSVVRASKNLNWVAWAPGTAVVATASANAIALVGARGGRLRT